MTEHNEKENEAMTEHNEKENETMTGQNQKEKAIAERNVHEETF